MFVRVDTINRRINAISSTELLPKDHFPVFVIHSDYTNADHYIIEEDLTNQYKIKVREITAEEKIVLDAKKASRLSASVESKKKEMMRVTRNIYDSTFFGVFSRKIFMSHSEVMAVLSYTGDDGYVVDTLKPLAQTLVNAYCEWRFSITKDRLDTIINSEDPLTMNENSQIIRQNLIAFLTSKGIDPTTI